MYFSDDHPLSPRDRSLSGGRPPHCANPAGERGADPHRFFHLSAGHGGYRAAGGHAGGSPWQAPRGAGGRPHLRGRLPGGGGGNRHRPVLSGAFLARGGRWSALHHDLHRAAGCAEPGAPRDGPLPHQWRDLRHHSVLAPVLGYLILSHFEWRGIFVGMALVAAISALVNLRLLKETRPARQPAGASPLALLGMAPFMQRALLTSASVTAILVYVSVSPLVLMTTFGLSPEQYTRLMMAMAGVSMSASFLTPLLLRLLNFLERMNSYL